MLVRPCHNAQMVKLTMLTLISGAPFTHMSGYAEFSWALLASGNARWSVSQKSAVKMCLPCQGGWLWHPPSSAVLLSPGALHGPQAGTL